MAVLERRLDFALRLVLDPCLPLMVNQPSGDKIVVIGVQDPLPPLLVLKPVQKVMAR